MVARYEHFTRVKARRVLMQWVIQSDLDPNLTRGITGLIRCQQGNYLARSFMGKQRMVLPK